MLVKFSTKVIGGGGDILKVGQVGITIILEAHGYFTLKKWHTKI